MYSSIQDLQVTISIPQTLGMSLSVEIMCKQMRENRRCKNELTTQRHRQHKAQETERRQKNKKKNFSCHQCVSGTLAITRYQFRCPSN
jgi:hypothetical protein